MIPAAEGVTLKYDPTKLDKIAPALVKVQAAIKVAKKDKENPFFKSKYADLGACWLACHEELTANEIAVIQAPQFRNGVQLLETLLLHSSGQTISGEYLIRPVKDDPQGYGSAVTYARRYSLAAMVGILQEDDDGRIASLKKKTADTGKIKDALGDKKAAASGDLVSATEKKSLWKAWEKAGISNGRMAQYLLDEYGYASTSEIKRSEVGAILEWIMKEANKTA